MLNVVSVYSRPDDSYNVLLLCQSGLGVTDKVKVAGGVFHSLGTGIANVSDYTAVLPELINMDYIWQVYKEYVYTESFMIVSCSSWSRCSPAGHIIHPFASSTALLEKV